MQFPITLSFKILALAPQIKATTPDGNTLFYVKQKLLKLKEAITVFADESQNRELYKISADRVIDFSAKYNIKDTVGNELGGIKRQGMRSIWKARYDIFDQNDNIVLQIEEDSAFVRVMDAFFGEIPVIGVLSGYVFNPVYRVETPANELMFRITKQRAFLESSFTIEKVGDMSEADQLRAVLSTFMMVLLERSRG